MFVFYDDVQYDKHGWRNRNRIKTPSGPQWLTIPALGKGNTAGRRIDEIGIDWTHDWRKRHLGQLRGAYARAPYFSSVWPLIEKLYERHDLLLADFTIAGVLTIAQFLGFDRVEFVRSSTLGVSGAKTARLVDTLRKIGATKYVSGPSARAYIEPALFERNAIALEYIEYAYEPYEQLHPPYDPSVSILDTLFMTGPDAARLCEPLTSTTAAER
ncbi:MAG: WbqC family protein [Candidatus Velthaea sp.]